mmetsp:Transcript_17374/g.32389  ORF Transcript_17374/g.32389 Transcript_17374/m.32389 type:complete len:91 (+) Transcript_17374:537-809(+)
MGFTLIKTSSGLSANASVLLLIPPMKVSKLLHDRVWYVGCNWNDMVNKEGEDGERTVQQKFVGEGGGGGEEEVKDVRVLVGEDFEDVVER